MNIHYQQLSTVYAKFLLLYANTIEDLIAEDAPIQLENAQRWYGNDIFECESCETLWDFDSVVKYLGSRSMIVVCPICRHDLADLSW
jgi:hypothetical protein